mgnify:CR=1 FL=1
MTKYPFIPVNIPLLDGNEKKYLNECIDTGWISSEGKFVNQFEDQFANRLGRNYAIAVTSGTAALDVAIEALLIGPGDEVILPAFTIISCINQVIRSGATPVLVDSDPLTWNMNLQQVEEKITEHTKAILVVHIFGLPVDIDPILELAQKKNIKIIEDAAEMLGQTYNEKPCGSFGDISTFSFYPNKLVTTGEGGMIVTNDKQLADDCRSLRNLCFQPKKRFVHERLGWNYRMTNIQAALGLAQLERLDEFVQRNLAERAGTTDEMIWLLDKYASPVGRSGLYATRKDYLRLGIVIANDWKSDTCIGKYLRDVEKNKISKGSGGGFYGGFFHFDRNASMKGHGGQRIIIDWNSGSVLALNAKTDDYDFKNNFESISPE